MSIFYIQAGNPKFRPVMDINDEALSDAVESGLL